MRRSQAGPHAASPSRKFTDEDECQLVTADIETFQILCRRPKFLASPVLQLYRCSESNACNWQSLQFRRENDLACQLQVSGPRATAATLWIC